MQMWSNSSFDTSEALVHRTIDIEPTLLPHSCLSGVFLVFMCICYLQHAATRMQHVINKYQCLIKAKRKQFRQIPLTDSFVNVYLNILDISKKGPRLTSNSAYNYIGSVCSRQKNFISLNFNVKQFGI